MMKATTTTSTASRQVNWSWRRRSYLFTSRSARRGTNAECRTQNAEAAAPHSAFCILHSAFASTPSLFDCDQHPKEVHGLPHVVHAHHGRAGAHRGGHGGERADGAIGSGLAPCQMSDERLARRADHHRRDAPELVRARQELEIVL